jgi:hypothetical protein
MNSSRNAEDLSEHCLQRIEDPANAMGPLCKWQLYAILRREERNRLLREEVLRPSGRHPTFLGGRQHLCVLANG